MHVTLWLGLIHSIQVEMTRRQRESSFSHFRSPQVRADPAGMPIMSSFAVAGTHASGGYSNPRGMPYHLSASRSPGNLIPPPHIRPCFSPSPL